LESKQIEIMKVLLSQVAVKLIENNFSDKSILVCGSILKEAFVKEGFSRVLANEFAIDALKLTLTTLKSIK